MCLKAHDASRERIKASTGFDASGKVKTAYWLCDVKDRKLCPRADKKVKLTLRYRVAVLLCI